MFMTSKLVLKGSSASHIHAVPKRDVVVSGLVANHISTAAHTAPCHLRSREQGPLCLTKNLPLCFMQRERKMNMFMCIEREGHCILMNLSIYIYIYTHTYVYTCVCMWTYTYVYVTARTQISMIPMCGMCADFFVDHSTEVAPILLECASEPFEQQKKLSSCANSAYLFVQRAGWEGMCCNVTWHWVPPSVMISKGACCQTTRPIVLLQ